MRRLRVLSAILLLLCGCGGSGGNGVAPSTDSYVGTVTAADTSQAAYFVELDLVRSGSSVSGQGTLIDASDKVVRSGSVSGTASGNSLDLSLQTAQLGTVTIHGTVQGENLSGTYARTLGSTNETGTFSAQKDTALTVDARGTYAGTLTTPSGSDPATMEVNGQNGTIASGFVATRGLTLPIAFRALLGTTAYSLPNDLGQLVTTVTQSTNGLALDGTLTIGTNSLNVPVGTYTVTLLRKSTTPTAQVAGIWVGTITPSGQAAQAIELQLDQNGTAVTGPAFIVTGSTFETGSVAGTVTNDAMSLSLPFGGTTGTLALTGTITGGSLYTGNYAGSTSGSFTIAKTIAQVLDLKGTWKGSASVGVIDAPLTMVITDQSGAIAYGTLSIDIPGSPTGKVYLYAIETTYSGSSSGYVYTLNITANHITGAVTVSGATYNVDMTKQ